MNKIPLLVDVDAMRADILRRLYEATKSFYIELQNLDILEEMLTKQAGQTPPTEKNGTKPSTPKRKPNGKHLPYADMTQRLAILDIVGKESGLESDQITERLIAGGFPFQSHDPKMAVRATLTVLRASGALHTTKAPGRLRRNKVHHYDLPSSKPRQTRTAAKRMSRSNGTTGINAAVLKVLAKAPAEGFDRGEVVTLLDNPAFDRSHVTWALNGLVKHGDVKRHLNDSSPADTRFTLV